MPYARHTSSFLLSGLLTAGMLTAVVSPASSADPTPVAPRLVRDILPGPTGSDPGEKVVIGASAYFVAAGSGQGAELWRTDGTENGTVLVKDIRPGAAGSDIRHLTRVGNTLYFVADDGPSGSELWRSDGTTQGTYQVADLWDGTGTSSPSHLTAVGNQLFFSANGRQAGSESLGAELWKSDGTPAGTTIVKDIAFGTFPSAPANLTALGNVVVFSADDGTFGREVWRSDGTAGGTFQVRDLTPGSSGSTPGEGLVSQGRVYFAASGPQGRELWRTDGTEAGTTLVHDITPGGDSNPTQLTDVAGRLYFTATSPGTGRELWTTNGTSAGTTMVKDIRVGSSDSAPTELTAVANLLLFSATDNDRGSELWRSDGTESGTYLVEDIAPGTDPQGFAGSKPTDLVADGSRVYFSADDHQRGRELWVYDASSGEPSLLSDLNPGGSGSSPSNGVLLGNDLVFSASEPVNGRELFAVQAADAPAIATSVAVAGPTQSAYAVGGRFVVTVSAASGMPSGSVTIAASGLVASTMPLVEGKAQFTLPANAAVGRHVFNVRYSGGSGYAASSGMHAVTVVKAASRTTLTASRLRVQRFGKVSLAAVARVPGVAAPRGTFVLRENGKVRARVSLKPRMKGRAIFPVRPRLLGKRAFQVTFSGDKSMQGSRSGVVRVTVTR